MRKWLEEGEYPQTAGKPDIYMQGSFRLGTVIRPLKDGEEADYDIDLACELRSSTAKISAQETKQCVGRRLKAHAT